MEQDPEEIAENLSAQIKDGIGITEPTDESEMPYEVSDELEQLPDSERIPLLLQGVLFKFRLDSLVRARREKSDGSRNSN